MSRTLIKVGAVLALLGSVLWGQFPIDLNDIGPGPLIMFIASFITWISLELSEVPLSNKNSNEDAIKLNAILKFIDKNTYYNISKCYLETTIGIYDYKGLEELLDYRNTELNKFHDKILEKYYSDFCAKAKIFLAGVWTLYTSDGGNTATWRPIGNGYVSDARYQEVRNEISRLNDLADKLATDFAELIKKSQIQLKDSNVAINYYE